MNILPKKRWHVRTKENVARVQKDEEDARIKEEEEQARISKAESEARVGLLRQRAAVKYSDQQSGFSQKEHINLFASNQSKATSNEAAAEKHNEQKEWEIKVGYLKPLGHGSNELSSEKPWYQSDPGKSDVKEPSNKKRKFTVSSIELLDPMNEMRNSKRRIDYQTPVPPVPETVYVDIDFHDKVVEYSNERKKHGKLLLKVVKSNKSHKKKKKKKKYHRHKSSSSESDVVSGKVDINKLREDRLSREKLEQQRTKMMLNPDSFDSHGRDLNDLSVKLKPVMKQKYNSQFNPEYVKSNYRKR